MVPVPSAANVSDRTNKGVEIDPLQPCRRGTRQRFESPSAKPGRCRSRAGAAAAPVTEGARSDTRDVAKRMGSDTAGVSRFESGVRDLRQSTTRRYAQAVGAVIRHRVAPFREGQDAWLHPVGGKRQVPAWLRGDLRESTEDPMPGFLACTQHHEPSPPGRGRFSCGGSGRRCQPCPLRLSYRKPRRVAGRG